MIRRPLVPVTGALAAGLLAVAVAAPAAAGGPAAQPEFRSVATFDVSGEVAEILAVTPNGRTLLYTDSAAEELGIVDLTDPSDPQQLGTVAVAGEPTSVVVTREGRYALVTVDTSASFTDPSGSLVVVDLHTREIVAELALGGQPDSIAISPDGSVAAVAIENQRDEDLDGGELPQEPAGFLAVVELKGKPASWTVDPVALTHLDGALYPTDPEPEYVDINRDRIAAVTLQENNAVALVDLDALAVVDSFSAGTVHRDDADIADDGTIAFDDDLQAPREPDAVQWTRDGNLLTADEGDLAPEPSGGRGFTVFSAGGDIVYTADGSAEQALADAARYPDGRSDDKGAEFEGAEVADLRGGSYAFIGSERGDAVLVYRFEDDSAPTLVQVLATGEAPEGLLAVNRKQLFLTSNEGDGTISVFQLAG